MKHLHWVTSNTPHKKKGWLNQKLLIVHICPSSNIYILIAAQWCNPNTCVPMLYHGILFWNASRAEKHWKYLLWLRNDFIHAHECVRFILLKPTSTSNCGEGSYSARVCICACIRCTGLVTHGLRQSASGGRESLRWVGLKTSDAWLRGPGSSSRRLLLLSVWICVSVCVFMWVWFGGPEGLCGAILAGESGKTLWSDKSSSVPCSISVCCLGCNTLLPFRV